MSRRFLILVAAVLVVVGGLALLFPTLRDAWAAHRLVEANVVARGGRAAWNQLEAVRFTGTMEIGGGHEVPFTLEQVRGGKMRLDFEFDGKTATQATNGEVAWQLLPYLGHGVEPMPEGDVAKFVDGADPRGLLIDHWSRGFSIGLQPDRTVEGRVEHVVRVILPHGDERTVALDAATNLETEVVSSRRLGKKDLPVHTTYSDWRPTDGILFPTKQVTQTEGDVESHALVIKSVTVNPVIDAARFDMPAASPADG